MRAMLTVAAICLMICSSATAFQIPANNDAQENGVNGTAAGREALTYINTANATLVPLSEFLTAAHEAAEYSYVTAYAGQQSGTLAAVAAAGATLLAGTVALNNATSSVPEAQAALSAADGLLARIMDENAVQNSNATNANLLLAYQIAHDGTLAQYWQNLTDGEPMDNSTFADTIEFVGELAEAAPMRLAAGASPALASIAAEMVARNILAAIYVYEGNNTLAYQQGLAEARLILKAANTLQSGAACGGMDTSAYLMQVETAVEAANTAAESLSASDIMAARDAAMGIINSNSRCVAVSPSLAPSSAAASLGRKLL